MARKSMTLIALVSRALAFPAWVNEDVMARALSSTNSAWTEGLRQLSLQDPLGVSRGESNCGIIPCPSFDEKDAFVSITGEHEYMAPTESDIRGPCPGLNAAANHGYLPRNGIASIEQTVAGLGALYNLGPTLTTALAVYAVLITGNPLEGVWSIGGPLPTDPLTSALLGNGQGLSYSHNNYEGDASIGRNDIYLGGGDAHSLNVTKFEHAYSVGGDEDRYTMDKFRQHFGSVQQESIATNPYYFSGGAFGPFIVVPAAYNFVINLMSNHSAEEPSGYLDGYNFKSFFGITGEPGNFKWQRGQERVPENWYRRSSARPYDIEDIPIDALIGYLGYPNTLLLGGNTGTVNSFTGVDFNDLTGGVLNAQTLFEGNNFACFTYQLLEQGIPNFSTGLLNDLKPITDLLNSAIGPFLGGLSCPQFGQFNTGIFDHFPGHSYSPTGPDTNY
ncbi:Hypothetical protein R9X50_00470500 [Acrodontium crateriforme]|uniref:Heme haloperoxidase family profile domain-containing protein n=1 Tax=Acrodontium crateriforme TaxID=150365 RepID=A0AAQ3R5A4_9PEZI|nr:Hypothetical protein R9X50_00470500 [Acrodontium crateriforme]